MENTGFTAPGELIDDFDMKITRLKADEKIPNDASRSEVIRFLMREFSEGNLTPASDGSNKLMNEERHPPRFQHATD